MSVDALNRSSGGRRRPADPSLVSSARVVCPRLPAFVTSTSRPLLTALGQLCLGSLLSALLSTATRRSPPPRPVLLAVDQVPVDQKVPYQQPKTPTLPGAVSRVPVIWASVDLLESSPFAAAPPLAP